MTTRLRTLALVGACILFAATMEFINYRYIVLTHVEAPFWDAWDNMAPATLRAKFFAHHNEHRMIIPRIIFLANAWLTRGSDIALIILTHLAIVLNGCLLGLLGRRLLNGGVPLQIGLSALFAGMLLSLQQGNILEWGFMVQWPLLYMFATLTYIALNETKAPTSYLAGFLLALAASFCLASGALVLVPVVVLALLLREWRLFVFSLAGSAALMALQLWDMRAPHFPFKGTSLEYVVAIIKFAVVSVGAPVANLFGYLALSGPDPLRMGGPGVAGIDPTGALLAGAAQIVILAAICIPLIASRRLPETFRPLIALCGFVLVAALATAAGRVGLSPASAMDGRYGMGSVFFTICIGLLTAHVLLKDRLATIPIVLVVAALMVAEVFQQRYIALRDREWANLRKMPAAAILTDVHDQHVMGLTYPWSERFPALLANVKAAGLSLFADPWSTWLGKPLPVPVKKGACVGHLDGREPVINVPGAARVNGWASVPGHKYHALRLVMTDSKGIVVGYGFTGWRRQDVPAAVPAVASDYSGWFGYVRPGAAEPITPNVLVDGNTAACPLS